MFDAFDRLLGPGGFLARTPDPFKPGLESLEDRAVPAIVSGLFLDNAIYSGMSSPSVAPVAAAPVASAVPTASASAVAQITREVDFGVARTNASQTGALPMFDPSLGRLTSVQLTAQGNLTSAVQLENLEASATDMRAQLQGAIRFQVGNALLQAAPSRTLDATVGAFDGSIDLQGSSAKDFGLTRMDGAFNPVTLTNPTDVASFVGSGTLPVTQDAAVASSASGTGNLMALIRSTVQGKVKVVYTYQPRYTPPPQSDVAPPPAVSQPSKFFLISGLEW
jgi:hypothetical protein